MVISGNGMFSSARTYSRVGTSGTRVHAQLLLTIETHAHVSMDAMRELHHTAVPVTQIKELQGFSKNEK